MHDHRLPPSGPQEPYPPRFLGPFLFTVNSAAGTSGPAEIAGPRPAISRLTAHICRFSGLYQSDR